MKTKLQLDHKCCWEFEGTQINNIHFLHLNSEPTERDTRIQQMVTQNVTYGIPELDRLPHLVTGRTGAPQASPVNSQGGEVDTHGNQLHGEKGQFLFPEPSILLCLLSRRGRSERQREAWSRSGRPPSGRLLLPQPEEGLRLEKSTSPFFSPTTPAAAISVSGTSRHSHPSRKQVSTLNTVNPPPDPASNPSQGHWLIVQFQGQPGRGCLEP